MSLVESRERREAFLKTKRRSPSTSPSAVDKIDQADIRLRLSSAWERRGKTDRAAFGFREVLERKPDSLPAALQLGRLMLKEMRAGEAVRLARHALKFHPCDAELHKLHITASAADGSLANAFSYYGLEKKDTRPMDIKPGDLLCCSAVRNEALRLPFFLSYYREKGVSEFLIVDNGSTDGTAALLLGQPDVHLWHSSLSFRKANFGSAWFELLLRSHGVGNWVLTVDADELLVYPGDGEKSIVRLCRELDLKGKRVYTALLLDMYSDKTIRETVYEPGQGFLEACPFFDRRFCHESHDGGGPYKNQTCWSGGVRRRVFGGDYVLTKVPLLKYGPETVLTGGQHWTNRPPAEIAEENGCLLHFKFFSTFLKYAREEAERKEHYGDAVQYRNYAGSLAGREDLRLFDRRESVRYRDSKQLVRLGIMRSRKGAEKPAGKPGFVEFPPIPPRRAEAPGPFWSVKITVFRRLGTLKRALRSVLDQAPFPEDMEVEVVCDGPRGAFQKEAARITREIGGRRVRFHGHPTHLGHPGIFNLCLRRSRGTWVHILHDDDWVQPGFYRFLRRGLDGEPRAGAAFSRHVLVDGSGLAVRTSWLEREDPGTIDGWLNRCAIFCRLQFSSVVVKREVYEHLGGFCPQAGSAFDWEMWTRIAVHYPFWFDPRPLACVSRDGSSETDRLARSGGQVADAMRAVEIMESYIPGPAAAALTRKAREHYAGYALDLAGRFIKAGDCRSALANLREGLKCGPSAPLRQAYLNLIMERGDLP